MYTKVIDIDLRQTDDISTTPALTKTIRKDESQFTLLRLNLLPTYPLNLVLTDAKVFWSYNDTNVTNGEISNGYVMTHLPIEIAKQLNSASVNLSSTNFVMMTVVGYVDSSEVNFGSYIVNVYSYKGFDNIPENPDLTTYPQINTKPSIYVPGKPGGDTDVPGKPGGDTDVPGKPGGDTDVHVERQYLCYSGDKLNAVVSESLPDYPYFALSADLENVSEIDWVCNPNHVAKLLDGLYIESQNACMFEWATYVLTNTNNPPTYKNYEYMNGQIGSYVSTNLNVYYQKAYGDTTPDDDEYLKNYYYRKLIAINNLINPNNVIYCTTTAYKKLSGYSPLDFSKKYQLNLSAGSNSAYITSVPSTTTLYRSFSLLSNIANMFASRTLESSGNGAIVISDFILIACKTLYKEELEPDNEATKINTLISYVRQVKKEGWY